MAKKFGQLGLITAEDLIDYYPRRYDDYSEVTSIRSIHPGPVTIKAQIKQVKGRYARRGLHITEAVASDDSGSVRIIWFNQPYRASSLKAGEDYYISGEFGLHYNRLSLQNPAAELASTFPIHTARIIPIYRETKGLKSAQIRRVLRELVGTIEGLQERLPPKVITSQQLMKRAEAIHNIHFPASANHLAQARHRLGFEEVFELSLAALLNKYELLQETATSIQFQEKLAKAFVAQLPFRLTDDQRRVIWQVYLDMQKTQPMNRLVEGDVGSGKTVVAAMAALMPMAQDFQVALMAPTELLARQHAETMYGFMETLGLRDQVGLLIGSQKPTQKIAARAAIKSGQVKLIIGTHALIQENVDMHRLGLVVIDEQHRFGVEQRKKLQAKAGHMPHVLHMTATPIPRSLALTLYGDLDISLLQEKPAERKPIKTELVPPSSRPKILAQIDKEIGQGRQVYVVCPLVSASDNLIAKSSEAVHKQLSEHEFKHRTVGLLHGKLKPAHKERIMKQFVDGELDVLVATTVVEVGVDVPNATVMMIESPERFGLAQMHQLRGRVGRSMHQSYCYLMLSDSQGASRRLKALERSSDGFALAELDLELRGPGAIYGTYQHGQLDLRIAKLSDTTLITAARAQAQQFIDSGEDLLKYKQLYARVRANRAVTNLN